MASNVPQSLPKAGAEAKRAARSRPVEWLGRLGLLAQGFSYAIVGVLAIALALGQGGEATSRQGALKTLAGTTWGTILLVLLTIGFAGYAIWLLAQGLFDRGGEGSDATGLGKRASQLAQAAIYIGLAFVTVSILVQGRRGAGSSNGEEQATAGVLGWPGGRWIVLGVAAVIFSVAAYQFYSALSLRFMDGLETGGELNGAARKTTERVGVVGIVARGVVFGIAAFFLAKAAIEYEPNEAGGLDDALQRLANAPYGPWLLGVVAAGLVAFGVFCALQSRYRQV